VLASGCVTALQCVNFVRDENGLPPYTISAHLMDWAQRCADRIAATGDFSHDPSTQPTDVPNFGESIAWGYPTAAGAVQGWTDSTVGHFGAMIRTDRTQMGIGNVGGIWCLQMSG
jgi:uncharacterized protein YkwD